MRNFHINLRQRVLAVACLLVCFTGCLQLDTVVYVEEDGSATITERIRFSQRLLDLDVTDKSGRKLSDLLSKSAAQERMKNMGKGIRLISHKIEDVEQGARESITVYKIGDLNDFEYTSPFLGFADFAENNKVSFALFPLYQGSWDGRHCGEMAVEFKFKERPKVIRYSEENPAPPPPAPISVQTLRELQPAFRDMLKGFQVRLAVESFAPLRARRRIRGFRAGVKSTDIINFTDKDRDRFGYDILTNEEFMLDLLRGKMNSPNITDHTNEHSSNLTVPVYYNQGIGQVWLKPSRKMFDKHFKGKDITFYFEKGPRKTRPATWEEIGYKGSGKK